MYAMAWKKIAQPATISTADARTHGAVGRPSRNCGSSPRQANQPVSPDVVTQALGPNVIGDIAAKLGVGQGDAAGGIAQVLPELIDKLTPHGQAPQGGLGSEGDIMGALTRMLGR